VPRRLDPDEIAALGAFGLQEEDCREFAEGKPIVFPLETEGEPGIAVIELCGDRLCCGVIEIRDPGGGLKSLLRFRGRCVTLARALGLYEFELFGAEIVNPKLEALLQRRGFLRRDRECPESLGGGTMEVLYRVETVAQ
jgi:hypothetical protein